MIANQKTLDTISKKIKGKFTADFKSIKKTEQVVQEQPTYNVEKFVVTPLREVEPTPLVIEEVTQENLVVE